MKVYKFGALRPTENLDKFFEQTQMAHALYQRMVEERNAEREAALEPFKPFSPPHENCYEKRLAAAREKSKQTKKRVKIKRCKKCDDYWIPIYKEAYKTLEFYKKPTCKEMTAEGLYWGTYQLIAEAFDRADDDTKLMRSIKYRKWPKVKHAVRVQIQDPEKAESYFRVEAVPDRFDRWREERKRPMPWRVLWIRVGSDGRKPIWLKVPYKEHRPIDGRVTHVTVQRYFIADRERWEVLFTCKSEAERRDSATKGLVAVDVGWRKMDDGSIRCAYAQDVEGNVSELRLPPEWIERITRADRIRGHRDENLNALLETAGSSLTHGIRSWAGVRRAYRRHLEAGGEKIAEVEEALKRDRHLWQYELGNRVRAERRRRNDFRVWARELRRCYAVIVTKNTSHKEVKEKANKGPKKLPQKARNQGQHAAPGELIETLRRVFGWEGPKITGNALEVSAENTSRICAKCFHENEGSEKRIVVCEKCGVKDDRDHRSTRNMLRDVAAMKVTFGTARKRPSKYANRHKKKESSSNASETAS